MVSFYGLGKKREILGNIKRFLLRGKRSPYDQLLPEFGMMYDAHSLISPQKN